METTLVTTGIVCILGAIVGGGLKALGIELPTLHSPARQIGLALFGIGLILSSRYASVPSGSGPAATVLKLPHGYNFAENAERARWFNGNTTLEFPGTANDARGFALYQNYSRLMDGETYPRVLETHPEWVPHGRIWGVFANVALPHDASQIFARVGLLEGATGSDGVRFFMTFKDVAMDEPVELGETYVRYGPQLVDFQVDVRKIQGKTGDLAIGVDAGGDSGRDWAVWT